MTGRAGKRVKINALVFETRMLLFLLAMATETGFRLVVPVTDRIGLGVDLVAGRAVDCSLVMDTAGKMNRIQGGNTLFVAAQAGFQLFIPR